MKALDRLENAAECRKTSRLSDDPFRNIVINNDFSNSEMNG